MRCREMTDARVLFVEVEGGWEPVTLSRCSCGAAFRLRIKGHLARLYCQGCWYEVYHRAIH